MAEQSKIEWCDSTFNSWSGCTKVSPACDHCYAEALSKRAPKTIGQWGAGAPRRRTSAAYWRQPLRWNGETFVACSNCGWRGGVQSLGPPTQAQACPTCGSLVGDGVHKARRRVFCASLADWLDNEVPIEWLVDLLNLIRLTPNLDWLLLTKRIGNWRKRLEDASVWAGENLGVLSGMVMQEWIANWFSGYPHREPKNIWMGSTICNQDELDRDAAKLIRTPAAKRFLSIEPMLGAIDLTWVAAQPGKVHNWSALYRDPVKRTPVIDLIICGGESGPRARSMHPDWARSLRDQCAAAGVPFFMKQMGGARDKRGDLEDLPEDLRVRQHP